MHLDKIREKIAEEMSSDMEIWNDVLNETSPGNYGCDDWDAEVDFNDVFADIPNGTFKVRNGNFSADLVMGGSRGDSSFNTNYSKPFSATGKFEFVGDKIKITEIEIDIDSDVFGDD